MYSYCMEAFGPLTSQVKLKYTTNNSENPLGALD